MHTNWYVKVCPPFGPGRFTPGASLVEEFPHGVDADVLVLGSGDLRDVLYTAFADKGLPERKIDFTICDDNKYTIARNVLFLTLVLDKQLDITELWEIYYEIWIVQSDLKFVTDQLEKLADLSETQEAWRDSPYGATLRFSDDDILASLHEVWVGCTVTTTAEDAEDEVDLQELFGQSLYMSRRHHEKEKVVSKQDVSRSCAPLAADLADEMIYTTKLHWDKIHVQDKVDEASEGESRQPNPLFLFPMITAPNILQYPTNPLLSFHMATAEINQSLSSPPYLGGNPYPGLISNRTDMKWEYSALMQFKAWVKAFAEAAPRLTVRFSSADYFAFCHTIRLNLESGDLCAQHYRANTSFDLLVLSEAEYGAEGTAPRQFDVIDTSILAGQVSPLNLLVSASGLLKDKPSSTIYTTNYHRMGHEDDFKAILAGHTTELSILLGLAPLEYWTNARAMSPADQVLAVWTERATTAQGRETLFNFRIAWKLIKHIVGAGTGTVTVTPALGEHAIARLMLKVYRHMFGLAEVSPSVEKAETGTLLRTLAKYTPRMQNTATSFTALVDAVCDQAQADSQVVWGQLLLGLMNDPNWPNPMRRFALGLTDTEIHPSLRTFYLPAPSADRLTRTMSYPWDKWSARPEQLAITFTVPTRVWHPIRLHPGPIPLRERETSVAAFLGMPNPHPCIEKPLRCICEDIQVGFGTISETKGRGEEDFALTIEEESAGWGCDESMIVSFYLPTDMIERFQTSQYATVGIFAQPLRLTDKGYIALPGYEKPCYVLALNDRKKVFITKHRPNQESREVSEHSLRQTHKNNAAKKEGGKAGQEKPEPFAIGLRANFNDADSKIGTITARVDVTADPARRLLADGGLITLTQTSPFAFQLTLGTTERVACPVFFPAPVLKRGDWTHIARTSGYIELVAPLVDIPREWPPELDTFLLPTTAPSSSSRSSPPVTLTIHNLNLDVLPILSLAGKTPIRRSMATFTYLMFSPRERQLRDQLQALEDSGVQRPVAGAGAGAGAGARAACGNSPYSARLAFKENLYSMFMLATGLHGGQPTKLFALSNTSPARGMHILVIVSSVRLDVAGGGGAGCGGMVLDAAVLPITREMMEGVGTGEEKLRDSGMEEFLLLLRSLDCCTMLVGAEELVLWKKTLPALAERCRTWMHRDGDACEYVAAGGKVPVSVVEGEQVLCSCGQGQFPKDYLQLPGWDTTAARYATRVAISPVYASALVGELIDPALAEELAEDLVNSCRNCGKSALLVCEECRDVRYCSTACQMEDLGKHSLDCLDKRMMSMMETAQQLKKEAAEGGD
ncbi:uncharacterized protein C8A04DRAFT_12355 [Dichotomopilus funicola]|uniref:MYND-type domain-containing protein n=1 Tax=Dichotomopilus funicola TaxID=1934379 RepID=A0AAN6V4N2_9PEZI|nr:hypothetical protein C8A04DRAFT_12355 [Dichotomopilus funicola]